MKFISDSVLDIQSFVWCKLHAWIRVITEIFELSNGSKIVKIRMRKKKEKKREKERRRKEKEKKLKNRSIYVEFAEG